MLKTKNILSLLLFFIMMAPIATPFLLQLKIFLIKIEAKERLEKNHLKTVHIPKKDIHWLKLNEEIIIGNCLFDVKQYSQNEEELIVKGIFDDEETALENQINHLWQQQKSRQGIFLLKYLQLLANTYVQDNNPKIEVFATDYKTYSREICYCRKDVFIEIPSPPPQV